MKTMMTWLLGLMMALLSGLALADAKVFSMTGTVSAATGPAPAQPVKVGDTIRAGQTAVTGPNSTVVLQFPDGHLASLTPNTRMTIEAYQYNAQAKSGNVLLNLLSGGMRAITGLIGRTTPDKVSYKAATATIGIRGTDATFAVAGGTVSVVVANGLITFTLGTQTVSIPAGSGVNIRTLTPAGTPVTAQQITVEPVAAIVLAIQAAAANAADPAAAAAATAIATAINNANSTAVQQAIANAVTPNTATVATPLTVNPQTGQATTTVVIPTPPPPTVTSP